MSEYELPTTPGKDAERRANIISITPPGQDPVIFWHQVAQDAIRSAETAEKRATIARTERERAERDLKAFTERLVQQTAIGKARTPLDVSRLVELAQLGMIDLNISVGIYGTKKGANSDGEI